MTRNVFEEITGAALGRRERNRARRESQTVDVPPPQEDRLQTPEPDPVIAPPTVFVVSPEGVVWPAGVGPQPAPA